MTPPIPSQSCDLERPSRRWRHRSCSRRRIRALPLSIALVAILGGSALFMSGYSMGRQSAVEPGHTGRRGRGVPAVLGHVPHDQRPLRRRRGRSRTLIQGAIRGMIDALGDPYSAYMTSEEYRESLLGISGQFEGIGAEIATQSRRWHGGVHAARAACRLVVTGRSRGRRRSRRAAGRRCGPRPTARPSTA